MTHETGSAPSRGVLMAIGGAEDKEGERVVLRRFVELAGGKSARIAVIPTASLCRYTGEQYDPVFRELGAEDVDILDIEDRDVANGDEALERLRRATGVFISGGAQSRLVEILEGTRLVDLLRDMYDSGTVVAGTSAGASVLSAHVVEGTMENPDVTPRKGLANIIAGFGLAPDLIIDQHFSQRARIGRLLVLFAASPGLIGLGIDEDTAALLQPDDTLEVIGENSVTIIEGRDLHSNYFEVEDGELVTVSGPRIHILAPGDRFDLKERKLLPRIEQG